MWCEVSIVDRLLNKSFGKLGIFIGHHPGYFIIIPVLLTLLCITGYQQIKYQSDPEYLFAPINGKGKDERAIVEEHFKVNYTHRFNVGRITRAGRFGRVIVTSRDADPNLLRREVFAELRILDDIIQNTTAVYDGERYTYDDICARWDDSCFSNDILNLDQIMDEILSGEIKLTFPIMFNPVTWDAHAFPVFFGGTKLSSERNIISVPSIQMVYFATAGTKRQDVRGSMWEDAFLENVGRAENSDLFKYIRVAMFASRTLDNELERNTQSVVPYIAITFILMAVFSVITSMMWDQVRSKPWMGLLGNLSAIMATCAAFGLSMYLGIEFIGINLAAPFLMISMGIDDTFVMLAAWRRTSWKMPVPQRMGLMMSDAAVSITITSVTNIVSFGFGIVAPFRSVQIFSLYSSAAVLFIFVWHITFFAGCMAVSGYMEARNMHSLWFVVRPLSVAIKEKRNWLYRTFVAGGNTHTDPDHPLDNREHVMMAFFRDHVANVVNNPWMKALILIGFIVYLLGAGYGVTQIREGLERRKLSKADSYSVKFFDLEDEYYREFPYRMQLVLTGDMNYSDPVTQERVEKLTERLENTSYVTSSLYTESWLRTFLSFVERNNDFLNVTIDNEVDFIAALREHWLIPGNPYSLDVRFNDDHTRILASRLLIQAVNITDTNHEKEMLNDLRQICLEAPLEAHIFHPYFVFFDQFELVRPMAIQSMCYGALFMMIISYIFIPNVLCSLWVALCIVSIELGVAGYMSLWDVNLDSISMINLIMCIGFSVDYTAHICYAYMSSEARRPDDRVRDALYSLGMPIGQAATSTVLGTIGLLLADSYIFLVFFKMIFLVIFIGAMHGLFVLPVLLSLFGPGSCTSNRQFEAEEHEAKLAAALEMDKSSAAAQIAFPPYYLPHAHPQLALSNGGANGGKSFLGAPYKAYGPTAAAAAAANTTLVVAGGGVVGNGGVDDKDQGIGTSGEDSSESSSSKSQRRKALEEDETIRGRYEEGWRRSSSSHNLGVLPDLAATTTATAMGGVGNGGGSQFQPVIDLYGMEAKHMWTGRNYNYDDSYVPQRRPHSGGAGYGGADVMDAVGVRQTAPRRSQHDANGGGRLRKRSEDMQYMDAYGAEPAARYYGGGAPAVMPGYGGVAEEVRRKHSGSEEQQQQRRPRKYSPPEGIYRPNPNRSGSQHSLYYPRTPQRSSSYHNITQQQQQQQQQQLRHTGDIRFP